MRGDRRAHRPPETDRGDRQPALTGFTAPKLLWLREHEPDVYERIAHFLLPKDYVRLRLCGGRAIDVADASGTLLFDVAQRRWSEEVFSALEIDTGWLPRALESPEVSGETSDGIPVAAGAGDQAAGALGVAVVEAGAPLSVVLGTCGVVFCALPRVRRRRGGARPRVLPRRCRDLGMQMGVMLSAAGSLAWLRSAVGGGSDYGALVQEAAAWGPGVEADWPSCRTSPASAPRTPTRTRVARSPGLSLRHDRGALRARRARGRRLRPARLPGSGRRARATPGPRASSAAGHARRSR